MKKIFPIVLNKQHKKEGLVLVALLSLALFLALLNFMGPKGNTVQIRVGKDKVALLPLDKNATGMVYDATGDYLLTWKIEYGHIKVTDSSCRDKICQKAAPIRHSYETIVCLPNQVVLSITESGATIDGVLK